MSVNSANPSTLFGGTWEAWGSGRVPVGVDTSDDNFSTVEQTGGESEHTLTIAEMPAHTHRVQQNGYNVGSGSGGTCLTYQKGTYGQNVASTGGDGAHNNLQPYITCYMWKRTA